MTERLTEQLAGLQRAMAAPLPSPEELAAGKEQDRAMAERIVKARPGLPLHHAYATLETLRTIQRVEAAKAEPTAPEGNLRARLVDAFRAAAHDCPGDCGMSETECVDAHPIQVEVLHFDQIAVIGGPVEQLADVAAGVIEAEQERYEESVVGALNERNTRDCRRAEKAEAQVARVRAFLEDMAGWCSPHGAAADYARRGLDALDGVDPLTTARACSCGRIPDPGICQVEHSAQYPAGGHCACACNKETT